jgi:hypothetical protein
MAGHKPLPTGRLQVPGLGGNVLSMSLDQGPKPGGQGSDPRFPAWYGAAGPGF